MAIPTFTGKYASIRKDIYKGTLGQKFKPGASVYLDNKFHEYKTEAGYYKAQEKVFQQKMRIIDKVENAPYPVLASIYIDFKKGSMGAYQAKAKLSYAVPRADGGLSYKYVEGTRTGGYGYDKESTASAEVFNQSPFLKILYDARVKKKKLPYGAYLYEGSASLPKFAGGVGFECHDAIIKTAGYDVGYVPGSDSVTVRTYTLKNKRRA